jgi:hypothetical protein
VNRKQRRAQAGQHWQLGTTNAWWMSEIFPDRFPDLTSSETPQLTANRAPVPAGLAESVAAGLQEIWRGTLPGMYCVECNRRLVIEVCNPVVVIAITPPDNRPTLVVFLCEHCSDTVARARQAVAGVITLASMPPGTA